MTEFGEFVDSLKLSYFTGQELEWLWARKHPSGAMNSEPPAQYWDNAAKVLLVLDQIRARLGYPVKITSFYRNEDYNAAVRGAARSQHKTASAIDFAGLDGTPFEWWSTAKDLRATGFQLDHPTTGAFVWEGGIGRYTNFVHIDVRGYNADW